MSRHILLSMTILLAVAPMLVVAQETAEEIMALEPAKLIEILKDPEASLFAKAKACQRLAVTGDKTAVPALAALLTDEQLAHYARFGLEPIPDPSVDDVLRDAMGKLKGRLLVGVINSIGWRKDAQAVEALGKLVYDADAEVAQAAVAALGRISGPAAAAKLQQALGRAKAPVRPAVADAVLVCAEGLLAQDKREEALALYDALHDAGLPEHVRAAAARGAAVARQ